MLGTSSILRNAGVRRFQLHSRRNKSGGGQSLERFELMQSLKIGSWLFGFSPANAEGKFHYACNKQYFVSSLAKTKLSAESECCKYGMKLLYIESDDEIKCLGDMNNGMRFVLYEINNKNLKT